MVRNIALCDKCGKEVPIENDMSYLLIILTGDWTLIAMQPRHLLPTEDCEGSPSRAQYLEGQPLDTRGQYPRVEAVVPLFREAYEKMQEFAEEERERRGQVQESSEGGRSDQEPGEERTSDDSRDLS